jgi:hypothetical protein
MSSSEIQFDMEKTSNRLENQLNFRACFDGILDLQNFI